MMEHSALLLDNGWPEHLWGSVVLAVLGRLVLDYLPCDVVTVEAGLLQVRDLGLLCESGGRWKRLNIETTVNINDRQITHMQILHK